MMTSDLEAPLSAGAPRISVVMPTYRRPALLARCLHALLEQTLPGDAFEIVVVDDGCTDDTRDRCAELDALSRTGGGPGILYLRPHGTRGPAAARNRGWHAARGTLIAFTDDDTIPDPDWLRQGEAAMAQPSRVAAWGRVHVPLPERLTDNARNTAGLEDAVFVTANAFVRRDALERVGGFDERYRRAWREDTDLYFALLAAFAAPGSIVEAPGALVLHPVRDAKFGVSIGQQANMAFDALLFKKYPQLYDRHVGFRRPPPGYAAIAASTLAALLALPFALPVAAVFALLALAGILGFAARRLRGLDRSPRQVADMLLSSFAIPYLSLYWRLVGALRWRVAFY
jgi:glycosyltransferase involved in cell wall biosynthesis